MVPIHPSARELEELFPAEKFKTREERAESGEAAVGRRQGERRAHTDTETQDLTRPGPR